MKEIQVTETIVDSSLRETKSHGTKDFPLAVYLDDFSDFENGYICWHWHEEAQITWIIEGNFTCQVEKDELELKPGDAIYINSGLLHQIRPKKTSEGKLYSIIWKPELLSGNKSGDIYKQCIEPVMNHKFPFYQFQESVQSILEQVVNIFTGKPEFYAMKLQLLLMQIWMILCDRVPKEQQYSDLGNVRDDIRVKQALQFMEAHYNEDLSLDEIAKAALISRSELCRCFRRVLNMPPKEFLIQYRIRQASVLLKNSELLIAEVAETTGFSSPSHFGSYFYKYMGCTPREYRKTCTKNVLHN